jgi:carboxypeptidase C (cathepsin A)
VKGHIHYWYIEAETNPETAPVVYWTNGGPGGSGITTGLLTEMGQFQLDADSLDPNDNSTVPALQYNPYGWSKVANTVFVSQPKGVGFSYCDDASSTSECVNDDLTAAQDAYDFFVAFFDAYPQLKKNDFYLTAESYGGIYIPMFMDQIQQRGGVPNLKGAAIGDGCWGTKVGLCAFTTGKSQQIQVEFFSRARHV